jgi:hypothetical protein
MQLFRMCDCPWWMIIFYKGIWQQLRIINNITASNSRPIASVGVSVVLGFVVVVTKEVRVFLFQFSGAKRCNHKK